MKKSLIRIFMSFLLVLPLVYSIPVLENGSFTYRTASTWTEPNVVYVEINVSSTSPSSVFVIYNISKTSRCEATICQIFNATQTDPVNTPAATGSFVGNDCIIVGGFSAMHGKQYKLAAKGVGVDWSSWHDSSPIFPKKGVFIEWIDGGYGVPNSGWIAQAQMRCINSLWGEEIANVSQKSNLIFMVVIMLLILLGICYLLRRLYFRIIGKKL